MKGKTFTKGQPRVDGYLMIVNNGCWSVAPMCNLVFLAKAPHYTHILPLPSLSLIHSEQLCKELMKNDSVLKMVLTLSKER